MKKEYQKPEVEIIDLQAEEAITSVIPLSEGSSMEEDFNGETSAVDRPNGWT